MKSVAISTLFLILAVPGSGQQEKPDAMKDCPMHEQHSAHHETVQNHGDQAMGFPHDKTTHHFRLLSNGGVVDISVKSREDKADSDAIRSHLKHIAMMFSNGDFSTPMFIHDGPPPGTTTMTLMKSAIHYDYEDTPLGGRVRIEANDPIAVAAIHDFLRFQIKEHETGDSLEAPQN